MTIRRPSFNLAFCSGGGWKFLFLIVIAFLCSVLWDCGVWDCGTVGLWDCGTVGCVMDLGGLPTYQRG